MMKNEEKLLKLYKECIEELNNININFDNKDINICISNRSNKRYGCCKPKEPDDRYKNITKKGFRYIIKYDNYKSYIIQISEWVMDLKEDLIKNTIMHELIHCLPYCNNHGKEFKKYSNMINEKLGYNITRVGNKEEDYKESDLEYVEKEEYKYKIQCKKCGKVFYRKRLQKNFLRRYRCSKCLGKLKIIEVD